ncbi:MAG: lysophospholipase [Bacteroidales bacterium]|nr:lysophospholipase [Bacteroidales bacterium]
MLKSKLLRNNPEVESSEKFFNSHDGIRLNSTTWSPDVEPNGIISLVHDFGEHIGRYNNLANKLATKGFIVRGFDFRGHGRSEGKKRQCGGFHKMISDLELFLMLCDKEFEDIPHFIYAQGFGATIVLNYAANHIFITSGIIITSPWFELTKKKSFLGMMLLSLISVFFPSFQMSIKFRAEDMSRDLRMVHNYRVDPLIHKKISIRLLLETIDAGIKASMSIYKINNPLLVMHGTDDRITSCKSSRNFVRNSGNKTSYIEWEGGVS